MKAIPRTRFLTSICWMPKKLEDGRPRVMRLARRSRLHSTSSCQERRGSRPIKCSHSLNVKPQFGKIQHPQNHCPREYRPRHPRQERRRPAELPNSPIPRIEATRGASLLAVEAYFNRFTPCKHRVLATGQKQLRRFWSALDTPASPTSPIPRIEATGDASLLAVEAFFNQLSFLWPLHRFGEKCLERLQL
jgi:hypothetical protein